MTRNVIKQGDSVIQSLAECWYVQCTKLSFFIWLFLNYAFWFSVSFFLFFLGFRNFHEDRSPAEEWKHGKQGKSLYTPRVLLSPSARRWHIRNSPSIQGFFANRLWIFDVSWNPKAISQNNSGFVLTNFGSIKLH